MCAEQVKRKIEIFRGWLLVGVAGWAVVFMCHCVLNVLCLQCSAVLLQLQSSSRCCFVSATRHAYALRNNGNHITRTETNSYSATTHQCVLFFCNVCCTFVYLQLLFSQYQYQLFWDIILLFSKLTPQVTHLHVICMG